MQCSICLDDFSERQKKTLICGHAFHQDCIQKAYDFSITTCPLCRRPITLTKKHVSEQHVITEIISKVIFGYITIMCSIPVFILFCATTDNIYSCFCSFVDVRFIDT